MQSSRQSDTNSEAVRYGYGVNNTSYNVNMNSLGGGGVSQYYGNYSNYGGYPPIDKTYSVVTTEPVIVRQDQPLIIVDPICEPHVKSYLTWSVFNVFFCCILGGLVTVFMSCNIKRLNDMGKFDEANSKSWKVLLANIIITGVGTFTWLVAFPYFYMAIYPYLPKINY